MAGKSGRSVQARCPMYLRDTPNSISCEGLAEGSVIRHRFRSTGDCAALFDRFCCGAYRRCPLYQTILAANYPDYKDPP